MKRLLIFFSLLAGYASYAQETLSPLSSNPRLYYSSPQYLRSIRNQHKQSVIVQNGTLLIESDTLSLPFIDDFSYNTLKPFHYDQYIYDTIYRAYGPCDSAMNVKVDTVRLSVVQSYTYSFNTVLKQLDSFPTQGTVYHYYPQTGTDCFYHLADSITLYPLWYHYSFDSATGVAFRPVLDSLAPDTLITYAALLYKSKMPAYTKWIDNYANHNYTCPYLPPTIGVATLDGLNEFGRPYNNTSPTSYGQADFLTSKPLDLSTYGDVDSVYLSFFYEPRGFCDYPNYPDSLCLEFFNGYTSQWDRVWSTHGFATAPPFPDTFHQVIMRIPSTIVPTQNYFYDGFQFRFTNYATLAGNNDHWHIDYVRLDQHRSVTDTAISDIAFQYEFPSILKNFSEMPAWQYDSTELADSLTLYVANLDQDQAIHNPPATSYSIVANELYPATQPVYFTTSSFNAGLENTLLLFPSNDYLISPGPFDSLVVNSKATINVPNILLTNDTISHTQTLTNTYAYDDGTAERAYGLRNLGLKKFAYEFNLREPDTIVGYQVLFTNIDVNVSNLVFVYNVWDSIKLTTITFVDSPVYISTNQLPLYVDSTSGFTTYKMDPPRPVNRRFYFGWSQTDERDLQIGYDVNSTRGFKHMFIYTNADGIWKPTNIQTPGSPMIRILMRHSSQVATDIKDPATAAIKAYPNPTTGLIRFDLPDAQSSYQVELYSTMGQLCYKQTLDQSDAIDIRSLTAGIYLLRITDSHSGISYQNKIVKTATE
ncbi:MAG: hypothetical protein JWO03_3745 [Bacteroidetes bacterium]|nr:hypothetical protein [Bacteroidota bacterium]